MHRWLLRFLVVALAVAPCAAQHKGWYVLKGGFRFLNDIHFINANTGFVVGFNATVIRTSDGGQSWKQATLPKDLSPVTVFSCVTFSSPLNGCMTFGDSIMHSSDGGLTWQRATLDAPTPVSRIIFPSAMSGYATGGAINGGSAFFVTTDGGASWKHGTVPGDTSVSYWGCDFRDAAHGMLISAHGDPFCYDLWRTADAGQHWERITANVIDSCSHDLSAITHVSGTTWMIGGNSLQRSSDDGTTWTKVSILPRPVSMSFADSLTGYAGGNLKGVIYKTWDGGKTWKQSTIVADSPATINAISAPSASVAYAIGGYYPTNLHDDVIIKTEDGGGLSGVADMLPIDPSLPVVYPNPASLRATIVLTPEPYRRTAELCTVMGTIVRTVIIEDGAPMGRLDVSDLPEGLYFCRINGHTTRIGVIH